MSRWLVLFEDSSWERLRPLTDLLPVPALAFGASDLARRWIRFLDAELLAIAGRPGAVAAWRNAPPRTRAKPSPSDEVIAINAAALPGAWLARALENPRPARWSSKGLILGGRTRFDRVADGLLRGGEIDGLLQRVLPEVQELEDPARTFEWPWNFVEWNAAALAEDLAAIEPLRAGEIHPMAAVVEPARVRIERGARVDPFAVLDARGGPILLGEDVVVRPHTVVSGPCAVGPRTELLGGSIGSCTIGPECRIAGEVDSSIWQGYANKRHHGFVGHSVVGEWVNLGALTTTSDLKNNYGSVRVAVPGRDVDSGTSKVGSFLGAHAKTGIGSLLPTGGWIGTGSNLFGAGRFAPRQVPAFSWWDGERLSEHRLSEFLATAKTAMSRRGVALRPEDETLLKALHETTRAERLAAAGAPVS